jgi:hypothetical protein
MKPPVSVARESLRAVALFLALSAFPNAVSAQAQSHIGKWVLSTGKSVYSPGPPPRSQVRTYSRDGDSLKAVIETMQPLGGKTVAEYSARFDGKDYPLTGNSDIDAIALTRIDDWSFEAVLKRRGKTMSTVRNVVSKDGRTMTVTSKGVNARGQQTSSVAIFTKQ